MNQQVRIPALFPPAMSEVRPSPMLITSAGFKSFYILAKHLSKNSFWGFWVPVSSDTNISVK